MGCIHIRHSVGFCLRVCTRTSRVWQFKETRSAVLFARHDSVEGHVYGHRHGYVGPGCASCSGFGRYGPNLREPDFHGSPSGWWLDLRCRVCDRRLLPRYQCSGCRYRKNRRHGFLGRRWCRDSRICRLLPMDRTICEVRRWQATLLDGLGEYVLHNCGHFGDTAGPWHVRCSGVYRTKNA